MENFGQLIERLPDGGGAVFDGQRIDTAGIVDLARRAAGNLAARGIEPGERVAVILGNSLTLMTLWFGCALAGAEFVPVNCRLRGGTLRHVLDDSRARLVIADLELADLSVLDASDPAVVDAETWMDELANAPKAVATDSGGGCMIYTSGTTGRPKGVRWTSRTQALHALSYSRELVRIESGESTYSCLPLFHVTCMGVVMATLLHGGVAHVDRRFSASSFWERISATGSVFFPYVGSILAILLKQDGPTCEHRVRTAMGAAAPADVFVRFEERFGIRLLETYGQTELGSIWLANHDRVPGSVGKGCPRADFRLVNVDGIAQGAELQVRPHDRASMLLEYHDNDVANREAWVDGWYRTRDLATIDSSGDFRFIGRISDCLRRRGENVSAYEVERAILEHPQVLDAAVVGVDSELGEQDIAVYYIERRAGAVPPAELNSWCHRHLGDFMVPRWYRPVQSFPKTETQRTQKGILHSSVGLEGAYDAQPQRR